MKIARILFLVACLGNAQSKAETNEQKKQVRHIDQLIKDVIAKYQNINPFAAAKEGQPNETFAGEGKVSKEMVNGKERFVISDRTLRPLTEPVFSAISSLFGE